MTINEKGIINNLTISELEQIKKVAYEQGRADEKRENEQDAYHSGYLDGQSKCSFDNELKIRADERAKHFDKIMSFINTGNRGNCDYFIVDQIEKYIAEQLKEQRNELYKI